MGYTVSIPFKRERTFRQSWWHNSEYTTCFDSLQTGKHIQTIHRSAESMRGRLKSFDSLQTGKHIQTSFFFFRLSSPPPRVSIPFKRERTFRQHSRNFTYMERPDGFDSLQTGKHIQTGEQQVCPNGNRRNEFRFPSNGKAHSDIGIPVVLLAGFGFDSLQTGKHIQTSPPPPPRGRYNEFRFPSNGKAHSDTVDYDNTLATGLRFRFPSNGKAHSDITVVGNSAHATFFVSIPFKRERTFRHGMKMRTSQFQNRFDSLQTGKDIQTVLGFLGDNEIVAFRFPSNGKAHSDRISKVLQYLIYCFDSLQTGKDIQTAILFTFAMFVTVSIPFKRERTFRQTPF